MRITRTFHPVGQGAFYSERFNFGYETFNIVYDCGSDTNRKLTKSIESTIKSSFTDQDTIDILFISHFDRDHVNKISVLKNTVKEIKTVVYPLLQDIQKNILKSIYSNNNDFKDFLALIDNPSSFFGDDVRLIEIKALNSEKTSREQNSEPEVVNLFTEGLERGEYNSGTRFTFNTSTRSRTVIWNFIPYNYEFESRHNKLIEAINKASNSDPNNKKIYDKLSKGVLISNPTELKLVNKIYRLCLKDVNKNSMFLYSGPINDSYRFDNRDYNCTYTHCEYPPCSPKFRGISPGCLYTGDADFKYLVRNKVTIKTLLPDFFKYIGVIQIPHHGAIGNFKIDFFANEKYYCPMSFGKTNTHGHPSDKVIQELVENGNFPIRISEDHASIFIQNIVMNY